MPRCDRWILAALAIFAACFCTFADAKAEYRIAPAPAWVVAVDALETARDQSDQSERGEYYLLVDSQHRSGASGRENFRRYVTKALTIGGVESIANLHIEFDPAYQELILHHIHVIRGERVISKIENANIRVLQREAELESLIYDGRKSLSIFLDDVRIGDLVDYAYTLSGHNPVFAGKIFGSESLQFNVPVGRIHTRLLLPAISNIKVLAKRTQLKSRISVRDGYREYRWDQRGVAARRVESGAPAWYNPHPGIFWSEFRDWADVAAWAVPLYQLPKTAPLELSAKIEQIRSTNASDAERAIAVLRWVQSEIRYLGVEIGVNSHAPNPPSMVFQRRFGDCKDKALLTIFMLDSLGIRARPALVNTDIRRGITKMQASPAAFDHVLVALTLNKRRYWIDPTRATQEGDLEHLYQPDFGYALIVDGLQRELIRMHSFSKARTQRTVNTQFDLRAGTDQPIKYTVTTISEGARAESLRDQLASSGREEVEKRFLNYYANYYPGIAIAGPMEIVEDKARNSITTKEAYHLSSAPEQSDTDSRWRFYVRVPEIEEMFSDPSVKLRVAPLAFAHPEAINASTEVLLPEDWPSVNESSDVVDPAFSFQRSVKGLGPRITIKDSFRSTADEISSERMPEFLSSLKQARGELNYEISWTDAAETEKATSTAVPAAKATALDLFNWPVAMLAVFAVAFAGWVALNIYRYDPHRDPAWSSTDERGIAGWLLVPAFLVLITPAKYSWGLYTALPLFSVATWDAGTRFGSEEYHVYLAPYLLLDLIACIIMLVLALLLVLLFFQKRTSLPRLFSAFLLAQAGILGLQTLYAQGLAFDDAMRSLARNQFYFGAALALILVGYLRLSTRVHATFERRFGAHAAL